MPIVTSVKFTKRLSGDPKFHMKEWTVEVANDEEKPVTGAELMALAVATATTPKVDVPPKAAPKIKERVAPEVAVVEPSLTNNSVVATKKHRYNLEAVPIAKRTKAVKILEDAKAKYLEAEDLWESDLALPQLAKFLVE